MSKPKPRRATKFSDCPAWARAGVFQVLRDESRSAMPAFANDAPWDADHERQRLAYRLAIRELRAAAKTSKKR